MARRRTARRRSSRSSYRARAGSYYNRGRSYATSMYNKAGLNITMENAAGFAAAFVVPENELISVGALGVACAPIKGLGKAKGFSQGFVLGQLTQKWLLPKLGINIPNLMGATLSSQAPGNIV